MIKLRCNDYGIHHKSMIVYFSKVLMMLIISNPCYEYYDAL